MVLGIRAREGNTGMGLQPLYYYQFLYFESRQLCWVLGIENQDLFNQSNSRNVKYKIMYMYVNVPLKNQRLKN